MRPDLAALVGSRICHDLISPIGAISNGVELLSLTGGSSGPEMQLISESVENASARIRFFRVAFGAATPDQTIGKGEVLAILTAMARGGRFSYVWQMDSDPRRLEVRLAFLLLQCFETAMPAGGEIVIEDTGGIWTFAATGPRINAAPELWDHLGEDRADLDMLNPAQVHFALLPDALRDASRRLSVTVKSDQIVVRI